MAREGTIFAVATARGRGGVAVIRLSGPQSHSAVRSLAGDVPPVRRASLRMLKDQDGLVLDSALVLVFAAPHSYTGEDAAELHVHGGLAVSSAVLRALGRIEGLRPADAGEFTRRAVEAGKLDLTAAEAVADLVAAETEAQRRQALAQMGGGLATLYEGWRTEIIRLRALVEAQIDFADEDLGLDLPQTAGPVLARLVGEMTRHLDDGGRGERLRQGVTVAVTGQPNVGKSSILNRLVGRPAAIVSSRAGTTRDVIEVHLDLDGIPVILADTAGLRDSDDPIEAEGIARARAAAAGADLVLAVSVDGALPAVGPNTLIINNKIDFPGGPEPGLGADGVINVSALTGAGFDVLLQVLTQQAEQLAGYREAPVLTRARHRAALERAAAALAAVRFAEPELAAEDLRVAAESVGGITGHVDIEHVLDVIFGEFCIGK